MKFIPILLFVSSAVFAQESKTHDEIKKTAQAHGLEPALVLAVAEVESNFNHKALRYEPKFKTYSVGLFQLFYPTARSMGFKGTVEELMNPSVNTRLGVLHLKKCAERFDDPEHIICCHNAGFAVKVSACTNNSHIRAYVKKVTNSYKNWLKRLAE